ncbi:MAG TPA: ArsC/Spx/MgsR family protein [Longimicrobiales bacterium]|nr:ArsC/Spx/MgsR family protein [Longimicrobiales bacterium]
MQIFGTKKSPATRKALRFFAERRIRTHFVDLNQRAASPGELRRFVQKFGTRQLVDRAANRFTELGLHHAAYGDERWLLLLAEEPLLLKIPLVRNGSLLTLGDAEPTWREWTTAADHV